MKKKDWLFVSIIIIFGVILYANSLNNSFVWDDKGHIEKNDFIKDWNNLPKLFSPDYFELTNEGFALSWRPLTTLSYFISYSLWGINPLGYRWSSIINHLFNAVLVYLITSLLFRKRSISFLAGLFFIVHPINTEAVCGISFNENLLACLFLLGAFYLYVKTQKDNKSQKIRIFLWGISCLFYLLALFSKEVAISLPLIILAYDYCFAPEKNIRKRAFFYLGYAGITLFYLGIRFFVLQDVQNVFFSGLIKKDFLSVGVAEIIVSLVYFLKLLVLPVNLCIVPLISTPGSLFEPRAIVSIGIIIIIGVFSFFIYKYSKKVFWSLLWIFLNLLPILSIIPFYFLFSERYLYIPSVGFSMLLAIGIDKCIQTKRESMAILIFLLVFYSWTTVKRNTDWKDEFTLWSRTVKMYPNNYQAHNNLGCIYSEQGKYDEACREYKKALELVPHYSAPRSNLANVYMLKGEYYEAIKEVKEVLKLNPENAGAHNNLGVYYSKIGLYDQAIKEYKKVFKLNPGSGAGLYKNIGDLYRQQGFEEEAVKAYKYALKLNPQYVEAWQCLSFYEEKDEKDEIKKIIYFYKRIGMINSQIINKMNFKLAVSQPYLQGEIEKYLLEDNLGNRWLFETYPSYALDVAQIQEAIYYFALICGIDLPQVHCLYLPINGKSIFGSIQRFLPDMSSFCDISTKKLVEHQVNYIQKQHIFDWFILNHDSTKDNFLINKKEKIVGIDKDSAFNLLNIPSLTVALSRHDDPVNFSYYYFFWKAYVDKEISVDFKSAFELINYIQNLDNNFIAEIFKPVFYVYGKYSPSRYEILIKRKNHIQGIFKGFYKKLVDKRGDSISLNLNKNKEYSKTVLNKLKNHYLGKEKLLAQLQEDKTIAKQENIKVISSKKGWYTISILREGYQKRIVTDRESFFSLVKGVLKGLGELEKKPTSFCEKLAISLYRYQIRSLQKEMNIEDFEQDLIRHITIHPEEIDLSALESTLRVSYRKPKKKLGGYREIIKEIPLDFIAYLNYLYRPMQNDERKEKIIEYKSEIEQLLNIDLGELGYGILKETDPHFLRIYLENVPDSGWKYCLLGRMYRQREQYKKELQAYKKGVALNGEKESTAWLYALLGIYYEHNEKNVRFGKGFDIDSAILWFKRAIEINPGLTTARLNLANLYIIKENIEGTIEQFKEIIKIEPDYASLYSSLLAIIKEKRIESLQKIKMDTLDGEAHYIVGLTYQVKGQKREAQRHFKKARELGWLD